MEPDELFMLPPRPTGDTPNVLDLGDYFQIGDGPNAQVVAKTPDSTELVGARRALLEAQAGNLAGKAEDVQKAAQIENNRFLARGLASALSKGIAGRRNADLADKQGQTDRIVSGMLQNRDVTRRAAKDAAVNARLQGEMIAAEAELKGAQDELARRAAAFNAFNAEENTDRRAVEAQERKVETIKTEGEVRTNLQTLSMLQKALDIPGFNPEKPEDIALVRRALGTEGNPMSEEDAISLINASRESDSREQQQELQQIGARARTTTNAQISSANAIKQEEMKLLVGSSAAEVGRVARSVFELLETPSADSDFEPITTLANIADLSDAQEAARRDVAIASRGGTPPSLESFILASFPDESVRAGSDNLNAQHYGRLTGLAFTSGGINDEQFRRIVNSLPEGERDKFKLGAAEVAAQEDRYHRVYRTRE